MHVKTLTSSRVNDRDSELVARDSGRLKRSTENEDKREKRRMNPEPRIPNPDFCRLSLVVGLWSLVFGLWSPCLAGTALIPPSYKAAALRQVTLYKCTAQSIFSFSPDGEKVVYDMDGKIWLMWKDGSHKQPLTNGFHPSFSADGKSIVYQYEESVLLYEIETGSKKHLTPHGRMPLFSPAGAKLVYLTTEDLSNNLYMVESDNEQSRQLTEVETERKVVDYRWSPDGEWIVYTTQQFIQGQDSVDVSTSDIRVLNIAGSFHEKVISAGEGGRGSLSPQGRFLSYATQKEKALCLWRVSLEDGANTLLDCGDVMDGGSAAPHLPPSFSASGDLLYSFYRKKEGRFVVSWFNEAGAKVMDVAQTSGPVQELQWQPQGEMFGFFVSKTMQPSSYALTLGDFFLLFLNDEKLALPLPMLKKEESFMVPLKTVAQKVGADIVFHAQDKKVEVYHEISYSILTLSKRDVMVNGDKIVFQTAPQIINGHLYVPVDFFIKAFSMEASFDETGQKLYLTYKEKNKP